MTLTSAVPTEVQAVAPETGVETTEDVGKVNESGRVVETVEITGTRVASTIICPGQKMIAKDSLVFRLSEEKTGKVIRTIAAGEGLVVQKLGEDGRVQVRDMLNGKVGWVSVCEGGNVNKPLLRVATGPAGIIHVDAVSKSPVCGAYTYKSDDSMGFPEYSNGTVQLAFCRNEGGRWTFSSESDGTVHYALRSASLYPINISLGALRACAMVHCISEAKSTFATLERSLDSAQQGDAELFVDPEFPPNLSSITDDENTDEYAEVVWERVDKLREDQKIVLFAANVGGKLRPHPDDVMQGGLGDCWFLAAAAAMAEYEGLIENLFVDASLSKGQCTVRLLDRLRQTEIQVTIDTLIPCQKYGKLLFPIFAQLPRQHRGPRDEDEPLRACWALLLEKAVAKYLKNYMNMTGGWCTTAFQLLMMGNDQQNFIRTPKPVNAAKDPYWCVYKLSPKRQQEMKMAPINTSEHYDLMDGYHLSDGEMFVDMVYSHCEGGLQCGGTGSGGEGIAGGHAYTILCVINVKVRGEAFKLLQLRNPWGQSEWTGALADNDSMWDKYPELRNLLKPDVANDGIFYMPYSDFIRYYSMVFRSAGTQKMALAHAKKVNHAALAEKVPKRKVPRQAACLGKTRLVSTPETCALLNKMKL